MSEQVSENSGVSDAVRAADQSPDRADGDADPVGGPFGGPFADSGSTDALRARRPRRPIVLGVAAGVLLLLGLTLAWIAYTGARARHELQTVGSLVHVLRGEVAAGDLDAARNTAAQLRLHADRAHDLTTGPAWASAAAVPWLGSPLASARALTHSVSTIADVALPELVVAARLVDPDTLRRPDGSVDLALLASAAGPLNRASAVLVGAIRTVRASPRSTWLGAVDSARASTLTRLDGLSRTVEALRTADAVVPAVLGAHGPRTYMVTFENEAELRGTGGLPGGFAILRVDNGRLEFTRFEPDNALSGWASDLSLGEDFDALWSGGPEGLYVNSNQSPHFPYAARIWAAMWQRKTGQQLDGALALDPTALSELLAVTGPVALPDASEVSAGNVVALTEQQVYSRFAHDTAARKAYLLAIARAVSGRLLDFRGSTTALIRAAAHVAGEHRLLFWTRDPQVERRIAPYALAGTVPDGDAPYAGLAFVNSGGTKLDYYLHAALTWQRSGCGPTRDVTVTLRLTNDAPSTGLPTYVLGYTGRPGFPDVPGVNRISVVYLATHGAALDSATLNQAQIETKAGVERGHPAVAVTLDLPLRRTQTLVLRLREPAGTGRVTVRPQPMVHPMTVTVDDRSCVS